MTTNDKQQEILFSSSFINNSSVLDLNFRAGYFENNLSVAKLAPTNRLKKLYRDSGLEGFWNLLTMPLI